MSLIEPFENVEREHSKLVDQLILAVQTFGPESPQAREAHDAAVWFAMRHGTSMMRGMGVSRDGKPS